VDEKLYSFLVRIEQQIPAGKATSTPTHHRFSCKLPSHCLESIIFIYYKETTWFVISPSPTAEEARDRPTGNRQEISV
jgi:hypothetical protein